jgi:hypothetical protein
MGCEHFFEDVRSKIIALHSTWYLSMDAWHNFYLHPNCSQRRKFAHSKEKLLTKITFAQSKNLLKKFAHSRNLLTEFARSIEKLLMMKNLAGSDGSTRWLNVSHQANRSTAGAHHSTVSVKTAGTCWVGPSSTQPYAAIRSHLQPYAVIRSHTQRKPLSFSTSFSCLHSAACSCVRLRSTAYGWLRLRTAHDSCYWLGDVCRADIT